MARSLRWTRNLGCVSIKAGRRRVRNPFEEIKKRGKVSARRAATYFLSPSIHACLLSSLKDLRFVISDSALDGCVLFVCFLSFLDLHPCSFLLLRRMHHTGFSTFYNPGIYPVLFGFSLFAIRKFLLVPLRVFAGSGNQGSCVESSTFDFGMSE